MALGINQIPIDQSKLIRFMKLESTREMRPALIRHGMVLLDLHHKSVGQLPPRDYSNDVESMVNELLDAGNDSAQCIGLLEKSIKSLIGGQP